MSKSKPRVILLIFIMAINLFSGCGKAGDASGSVSKFSMSEAAPIVETPDISIAFSPYDIGEIVFNSVIEMQSIDEAYRAWRLKFALQGKK